MTEVLYPAASLPKTEPEIKILMHGFGFIVFGLR